MLPIFNEHKIKSTRIYGSKQLYVTVRLQEKIEMSRPHNKGFRKDKL